MYLKSPSFSFIIFTYNSSDIILRTLVHLKEAVDFFPVDHEIILVDNNSVDRTLQKVGDFIAENSLEIKIVENPKQGLSYSRIEGVKLANKEFVCFVDDDNFLSQNWLEVLTDIISKYNPDVIGCRTLGISDVIFPNWWSNYQGLYACGMRFKDSGFLDDPLDKMWGAGLTARLKYLKPALLRMNLLCTDRIGQKQMSGGDTELNFRMRLLGAKFYYSNDLFLYHYMRAGRLNKGHLNKTRFGNGLGAINLDVYKFLLTGELKYKILNLAILTLIGALPLSIKYKTNYLLFAVMRFKTIKTRIAIQDEIRRVFTPIH